MSNTNIEIEENAQDTGNTFFLGIGINQYEHFTKLNNAVKDVTDIGTLLTTQFGFSTEAPFFNLLLDDKATRRNIIKAINQLCLLVQPQDRVLIYYSGHGYLDSSTNLGYWIPVKAEHEFTADYVSNSDVRDLIKSMKCRHILLISDSCFSESLLHRAVVKRPVDNQAFFDWERKASRWVVSSGKGVVPDGKRGDNSPFAKQLLNHLKAVDTQININGLANQVTTSIQYNYEQQPEASPLFGAGHDGGQFIFYKNGVMPTMSLPTVHPTVKDGVTKEAVPKTATIHPINPPPVVVNKKGPTNLSELKNALNDLVEADELEAALLLFKAHLPTDASLRRDLILLISRFNSTNKDIHRGIVTREAVKMDFARIRYSLTSYIEDLTEEDVLFT